MEIATYVALSRLIAQQHEMDVTAENIANANTPAYRAERVLFGDWLAKQQDASPPPGGQTIAYTQDLATWRDMREGTLTHTGNPLDLAITGDGYFSVATAKGTRLTRAGHFGMMPDGTIADDNGDALLDTNGKPIVLANTDTNLTIAGDGTISSQNGQIGRIGVVAPSDPMKLKAEGGLLYAPGGATAAVAAPRIVQGAIEQSNVRPVMEMTRMINGLRQFQFVTQFVQGELDRRSSAIEKILQQRS